MRILLILIFLFTSSTSFCKWEEIKVFPRYSQLYCLEVLNKDTVFLAGQGIIYSTYNSGQNWNETTIEIKNEYNDPVRIWDLEFKNGVGFCVGDGVVFRTNDYGKNWLNLSIPTINTYNSVFMLNDSTIWLLSIHGKEILFSTNSGEDWSIRNLNISSSKFHDLLFLDKKIGYIVGYESLPDATSGGKILKTENNCGSWKKVYHDYGPGTVLEDIILTSNDILISHGSYYESIKISEDLGDSWVSINTPSKFRSISEGSNDIIWYIGNDNAIYKSNHLFENFTIDTSFNDMSSTIKLKFLPNNIGYLLYHQSYQPILLKHTPTQSIVSKEEIKPEQYRLKQNYPNPFNSSTTIEFDIPSYNKVMLLVYNILGEKIVTLLDKNIESGNYKIIFNSNKIGTGLYIYHLVTSNYSEKRKMLIIN